MIYLLKIVVISSKSKALTSLRKRLSKFVKAITKNNKAVFGVFFVAFLKENDFTKFFTLFFSIFSKTNL